MTTTERERLLAECEAVCTSGCHSPECDHHGYIPEALAARQDEPSPALRERDLFLAMERVNATDYWSNDNPSTEEYARLVIAALAANPPQTREENR